MHRFRNGAVRLPDGLYWDVLGLYTDVLDRAAGRRPGGRHLAGPGRSTRGPSTTGCSTRDGALLGNPRHYRDARTDAVIDDVHAKLDPARLYGVTGLQFLPFNTLYQLAAEPDARRSAGAAGARTCSATGSPARQVAEETNASTTGLLDARTGGWSPPLLEALGPPAGLLPDVDRGRARCWPRSPPRSARRSGSTTRCRSPPSGRTTPPRPSSACPRETDRFGYISCGTWGLVGVELDAPVLTEDSRQANFTNERGVDGTIRYLRNVMGLWLLSESLRTWDLRGPAVDLATVLAAAAALPAGGPRIDPDDPVFLPPGDMPERIIRACRGRGDPPSPRPWCAASSTASPSRSPRRWPTPSGSPGDPWRSCTSSAVARRTRCCASSPRTPAAGRWWPGPVEATALGNVLVQARTHGVLSGDLAALRGRVRAASRLHRYEPR